MNFYQAWHWLRLHPAFFLHGKCRKDAVCEDDRSGFERALDIHVAKVDPQTRRVEGEKSRNTHTEIWLECGPWGDPDDHRDSFGGELPNEWETYGVSSHDVDLDCGGDTFEEAILKLATLVKTHYGDYDESQIR